MNPLNTIQRLLGSGNSALTNIGGVIGALILVLGLIFGVSSSSEGGAGSSFIGSSQNEQPIIEDPIDVDPDDLDPLPGPSETEKPAPEPEPEPAPAPVDPEDPSDSFEPGESKPDLPPASDVEDPQIDLPTAPEVPVVELGEVLVIGGVNSTNSFALPVVLELQSGDSVSTSGEIELALDVNNRKLVVTTTVATKPGTYLFTIDRGGKTVGKGSVVVSTPEESDREVIELGHLDIYPNYWHAWDLPAGFDYGAGQEVFVVDQNTLEPVAGLAGIVAENQVQVSVAPGAALGTYLVMVAVDEEAAALGTVSVIPEPVALPTAQVQLGTSMGLDLGSSVMVDETSVAGVYYAGTSTPVETVSFWYNDVDRKLMVTAFADSEPGTYDFYLYTGNYFIGKGTVEVLEPIVTREMDWEALREGRLNATWLPAFEMTLPDRPNYADGDYTPTWYPEAAIDMRNTYFLTPGSEFSTPKGLCSAGYFVTVGNSPYMLTAAHCGNPGDPVSMQTVYGLQQVGVFVPDAWYLEEENPDINFDPKFDFALVALNDFGAALVHPAVGGQFELSGFIDSHSLRNQDVVCRIGRTEGYSCGRYYGHMNDEIFAVSNILNGGDSGGPLFAVIDGKYYAVGITSLGAEGEAFAGAQRVSGPLWYFGANLYGSLQLR